MTKQLREWINEIAYAPGINKADKILALIKEAGYVKRTSNQIICYRRAGGK